MVISFSMISKRRILFYFVLLFSCILAGKVAASTESGLFTLLDDYNLDYRFMVQSSLIGLSLSDNVKDKVPRQWLPEHGLLSTEARLDLKATPSDWLTLGLNPRLRLNMTCPDEWHFEKDLYLNGWLLQVRPTDSLQLEWVRQNLQWGPSYLTSPSNPFGNENGKNMPSVELPATTYLKANWAPRDNYSISLLANVVGERVPRALSYPDAKLPDWLKFLSSLAESGNSFKPTYAIKNDFTFDRRNLSFILSKREGDNNPRAGIYGSWNILDEIIVYAEGSSNFHSDNQLLLGGTYTFVDGSFLALEYFRNEKRQSDSDSSIVAGNNSIGTSSGSAFVSRNYMLLQYVTNKLIDRTMLAARWIVNLDQNCHRLALQAEYELNDQTTLFANAVYDVGKNSDEYGSLIRTLVNIGVNFYF